ncbi:hypothetical protein EV424DRAFT_1541846 [Suillus variegatus]|nr:hypothetical protein EV424DRAFT_1541846 [Suillus variegatus]
MSNPRSQPSSLPIPSRNFAGSNHTEVAKPPHHPDTFSVVICGESGSGKSSLVNLIAGANMAVTSGDAGGCTTTTGVHEVLILNETLKVKLFDTVGLNEGPRGTVPDKVARRILKRLLRTSTEQGDLHLIMYCVQGEREIRTLRQNYQLIRSQVKGKVPIVLVITCLESHQPEMEDWWRINERTISKLGMTFSGHACITTATGPIFVPRRTQSHDAVCELIKQCRLSNNTGHHPNVVIFGQGGAGKSSLVNLIAGENVAKTSVCLKWEEYLVKFGGGSYNIFDTVGLEEPQLGIQQYLDAVENAYSLIQKLERQGGVNLLMFCVHADRLTATLQSDYRLFNEFLCEKKVPIVVVITRLENEVGEMDAWWKRNKDTFRHQEFDVDGHACITAIRGNRPERYEQSRTTIRNLVKEFTADGQKRTRKGGDNLLVSLIQKPIGLLLGKSRSKKDKIDLRLTKRCGLTPVVAKQLADRIQKDVGAT